MKSDNPSMIFLDELPLNIDSFKSIISPHSNKGTIVCFDDFEMEITQNISFFQQIWTVLSHHMNVTPIAVLHNLFARDLRTISLNTHRIILTKSLRDSSQISFLSRQCFPNAKNFLSAVYQYCLKLQDFPYIILNFSPGRESDNYIKVITKVFKDEFPMTVFKPVECSNHNSKNPYEKLVLINKNLYEILTSNSNSIEKEEKDNTVISNSASNSNSIEIKNINDDKFKARSNSNSDFQEESRYQGGSEEKEGEIVGKSQDNIKDSSRSMQKAASQDQRRLENDIKSTKLESDEMQLDRSTPADIPPMSKVFEKTDESKLESLKENHEKPKRKPVSDSTSFNKKKASRKKPVVKLGKSKALFNNLSNESQSVSTASNNDLPQNIDKTIKSPSLIPRRVIKRKAPVKINRTIHPFKKKKIERESKSLDNIPIGPKRKMKRKLISQLNREIIPYKARKLNRGVKRKNITADSPLKHFKDQRHISFRPNQTDYEKWNF